MAKQNINVGTTANDKKGDSLRAAFQKVNANFTELYKAVGLADTGQDTALTFVGSTIGTDDSSSIVIDRATTITSNLSVGGDIVPQTANGGDLGSSTLPWRSLYVSNNTIFLGGVPLGIDANGNLTVSGSQVGAAWPVTNTSGSSGPTKIAIGANAGLTSQAAGGVAIGNIAGVTNQGQVAVAIGMNAGNQNQGGWATAVGGAAGYNAQGTYGVAVGYLSGYTGQGSYAVAVGAGAANSSQGEIAVAVGGNSGNTNQGAGAVAVGASAGQTSQGLHAVAIGTDTGSTSQGNRAVAVGYLAGSNNQGAHSVAIGYYAGELNQGNNSIIINATGTDLQQTTANTFTVKPVRQGETADAMYYNSSTGEITYAGAFSFSVAADDSTQRLISSGELIKFIGAGTVTTSSDAEGNITITGTGGGAATGIESETDVSIRVNLTDSTQRIWQFGEDGILTLPSTGKISNSGYDWTFGTDGKLALPNGSVIEDSASYIKLTPAGGANEYQALLIYPTAGDGNHIHLAAPYGGGTELYLGNDLHYVKLATSGNVEVLANDGVNIAGWIFGTDGDLKIPGNIKSEGNINIDINLSDSTLRRWQFGEDGELTIPGSIIGNDTIEINNRDSGNTADINLYSADDILIQARDREGDSGSEGGDINIYAGDSAVGSDATGGDVQIRGGDGGAGDSYDNGGSGGYVTIASGQGGAASGIYSARNGGDLTLLAGDAGTNNGNIDLGAEGGDVVIEAGDSTGNGVNGGTIYLTSGAADASALAGSVVIQTGGFWTFGGDGALTIPGDIRSEGNINIDINLADSTLRRWSFGEDGDLILPAGGDIKNSTGTSVLGGSVSSLVNGAYTVSLSSAGVLTVPANGIITAPIAQEFQLQAKDADSVLRNEINLDPNNGTYMSVWSDSTTTFSSAAGSWATASWNNEGGLGAARFTGAQALQDFWLTGPGAGVGLEASINGGARTPNVFYDGNNGETYGVTLGLDAVPPGGQGTTVAITSLVFYYQTQSKINMDVDGGEILIDAQSMDLDLRTTLNLDLRADENLNLRGMGQEPVRIYTNNNTHMWEFDTSGSLTLPPAGKIINNNKEWTFGTDGSLQIPGDITSNSNINIDINLADSTLRRWQFGEDGILTLPSTGKISSGVYDWTFGTSGDLTIPGDIKGTSNTSIIVDNVVLLANVTVEQAQPYGPSGSRVFISESAYPTLGSIVQVGDTVTIGWGAPITVTITNITGGGFWELRFNQIITAELILNPGTITITSAQVNTWTFDNDGGLTFPDGTVQTTAWTGTVSTLSVTGAITAESFNTDQITVVGNRISTTVTNANLELECNGTGGVVINTVADATTASTVKSVGYLGLPQSATTTSGTLAIGDAGKHIYVTTTGQAITIPDNASVAYPIGTTLTFIAGPSATTVLIVINTNTLRLAGSTSTGTRTLAANGMATAVKVASTLWYINGVGLT